MIPLVKTKFTHNQKVFIKEGYYRGYKATIQEFREISYVDESTIIEYRLKIENLFLKEEYWIEEKNLLPYRKYVLF